jgi:hypothetical protein
VLSSEFNPQHTHTHTHTHKSMFPKNIYSMILLLYWILNVTYIIQLDTLFPSSQNNSKFGRQCIVNKNDTRALTDLFYLTKKSIHNKIISFDKALWWYTAVHHVIHYTFHYAFIFCSLKEKTLWFLRQNTCSPLISALPLTGLVNKI